MRASVLFGIAIAILFGLGVVVAAKMTGFFNPAPTAVKKERPIKVLVAKTNLFKGITITANDVMVRELFQEEKADYENNRSDYMPAVPTAAHLRIMAVDVPANAPLRNDYFRDLGLPDPISQRLQKLGKNYAAVHVSVPKSKAASGLLQVDERVDVYLTTEICASNNCITPYTARAQIARNVPIIAKRNNLWVVMRSVSKDEKAQYTLAANLYRAALIDFAQTKGQISLVPSSSVIRPVSGSFNDINSPEYQGEDARIEKVKTGQLIVGYRDLERIFNLAPIPQPPPPKVTQHISGTSIIGNTVFGGNGNMRRVALNGKSYSTTPGRPAPEGSGTVQSLTSPGEEYLGYQFRQVGSTSPRSGGG